jgi:hypothetical protein
MSRGWQNPAVAAALALAVPALLVLLALAGCASAPPGAPPSPAQGTQSAGGGHVPGIGSAPSDIAGGRRATASAPDTVPSAAAQAVLATIPEPLKPEERVAPPLPAPAAAEPAATIEPDTARAEIPVPVPVPVLGEQAVPRAVQPADTTPSAPSPAFPAPGPPPAVAGRGAPVSPDTCWRVQIAAPADRAKAQRYLQAGQSQLLVPLVVQSERGLYKVRTRDCLDRQAADALRRRALDAGFAGVFRIRGK